MFKKILIANRGEIACRVIWACRELGIKTVAVHSEADRDALHVKFADEAVCIGPAPSAQSYLHIPQIISAAEITNVDAIHPGYGFLSENPHFAEVCRECNITFIGPSPEVIRMMGDKSEAKRTMKAAGAPVIPGSEGLIEDEETVVKEAGRIGYPVLIKATAGGGGRGMRVAYNQEDLFNAYNTARAEAEAAFKNSGVYLEKYIANPRHIEIQVFGDNYGNVIHLGERECSIQRRHQKLIEESPSPAVSYELRQEMGRVAVEACKRIGYSNAGTIEFLLDEDGSFYFMEMNTRIQVEHPVTEMVTVSDLVAEQILIAAGEELNYKQEQLIFVGHAIECRVNAEDPVTFTPSPGRITTLNLPSGAGVRVDTAIYDGYFVPPYYDSLIAKVVVHSRTRERAIARMRRALESMIVEGVKTTIPLHLKILNDPDFIAGNISTRFMERFLK
ncbi:MAG TPA: acetyl-CoA carboxylase biotin carboxylase subunit [Blastocatellia bacterium]|jgi:acetyl-CoA carboxylase biotin carboxylase subunit|nr:acetyl-CoA carboxylase biotin carboxylase subunit [Blastocatellia bacterium]